jgi:COP9 signalosome complex subunit 3
MASQSTSSSSHLDVIVQQITAMSEQLPALNQALRASPVKDTVLSAVLTNGEDPLSVLDINENTLGVLFIL